MHTCLCVCVCVGGGGGGGYLDNSDCMFGFVCSLQSVFGMEWLDILPPPQKAWPLGNKTMSYLKQKSKATY